MTLDRAVQAFAGIMVIASLLLTKFVHPNFFWLTAFVGFNLFIVVNLALGFLISTAARNQMQAMQLTFFFFLPSLLLSGFMFPFSGMPGWAQVIGETLPLTHFLRIIRGIMLKGIGPGDVIMDLWGIAAFLFVVGFIAMKRFRRTLD